MGIVCMRVEHTEEPLVFPPGVSILGVSPHVWFIDQALCYKLECALFPDNYPKGEYPFVTYTTDMRQGRKHVVSFHFPAGSVYKGVVVEVA